VKCVPFSTSKCSKIHFNALPRSGGWGTYIACPVPRLGYVPTDEAKEDSRMKNHGLWEVRYRRGEEDRQINDSVLL